jgi:hypothetical protein
MSLPDQLSKKRNDTGLFERRHKKAEPAHEGQAQLGKFRDLIRYFPLCSLWQALQLPAVCRVEVAPGLPSTTA